MFGFEAINNLTHDLETIYQTIRDNDGSLTQEIFNVTLLCLDHLKTLLANPVITDSQLKATHEGLLSEIHKLSGEVKNTKSESKTKVSEKVTSGTYYILFKSGAKVLRNGTNTLYLVEEILSLGQGMSLPFFEDELNWDDLQPDHSYTGFEIILHTDKTEQDIREVFIFVEDESDIEINQISNENLLADSVLKENLIRDHKFNKVGQELVLSTLAPKKSKTQTVAAELQRAKNTTNVRVSSERLDELMNLVSELVTTQAGLSLLAEKNSSTELTAIAETVEKITRRLRDNAFTMSLVPVENLVVRFQRLVRDLSKELGKEIEFKTEGTETEIDKSIIEKLADPLMHLIRNGLDHGIELPEERVKKGKTRKGTILFKSYYSGAKVVIEVKDDGAGINLERVRTKAIKQGLISSDIELTESEIINLIFLPGFSTKDKITDVSGRGVGMDVVRRNIADIRGDVEVFSKEGEGSTFVITLPLTLSIIDGLLVNVGDTGYVIPLSLVKKCHEVQTKELEASYNHWMTLDGNRTPYFYLRNRFKVGTPAPQHSQVIEILSHYGNIGLVVDKIIGDYQAVLKPLGKPYSGQDEFSGATILGDGTVALVIDPLRLINKLKEVN
jgi:two-component system chemotaxis sensor kinase CheA